jgi:hypothetical protein
MKPEEDLELKRKTTFRLLAILVVSYAIAGGLAVFMAASIEACHRAEAINYHD